ncbi:MAG: acyl carrier protein [Spirochaetaceae bacterium]|nr:acyl carrier protein [Spirochaetaceae bacterium]
MGLDLQEVTEEMREVAANFIGLEPEKLDLNKKLRLDYGISSIEASELIMDMEDTYDIKIPVEDAVKILSTQDAIDYLMSHDK